MSVVITNGAFYPLYIYKHDNTYWTLDGKQITKEEADNIQGGIGV